MATLHKDLTANAATEIVVGNSTLDDIIVINYSCTRGDLAESGRIWVINDTDEPEPSYLSNFDDCGLWDTAPVMSYDGTDIVLTITVNNDSATDVTFNYQLTTIKK